MKVLLTTLHSKYVHASLALPCLATYCADVAGEILIAEYSVNQPKETLLAQITAQGAEVICFSVYIWNRLATLELVQSLKILDPSIRVVLGGPEVSFEDELFFDRFPVDALICGEGEIPLRYLLHAWESGGQPAAIAGLRTAARPAANDWSQLDDLDAIPSPFTAGRVDLQRGLVYYESSRGCPYNCSFCMSALDKRVRSFSFERIISDLRLLMDAGVPLIKFVDRTFNYDAQRARDIFAFILEHNQSSRFHFEIGAQLLDTATLHLPETVPDRMFQFEIGVQSTLEATLDKVVRQASLPKLAENVRYLQEKSSIYLHLDLIVGLPGEDYQQCLDSLDWCYALQPDQLQIETLKLLPGAPLRAQSGHWGLHFDPNPPYAVLRTTVIGYSAMQRLQGIGFLFDRIINSGRFNGLIEGLIQVFGRASRWLEDLDSYWREHDLYVQQRSLRDLYLLLDDYLCRRVSAQKRQFLRELLARDCAHHERIVAGSAPDFFDCALSAAEQEGVRAAVKKELNQLQRSGKVQYFAARFCALPDLPGAQILIFLYVAKTSTGLEVKELIL